MQAFIVTHGGVGAKEEARDGPEKAAEAGLAALSEGRDAMEAAVRASVVLEDDPRFNAGTGSRLCIDGKTLEMDASVMDEAGRMGAVAAIQRVKNPILVARAVMDTPHAILAGAGAEAFARWAGFAPYDPTTPKAKAFLSRGRDKLEEGTVSPYNEPWLAFMKRYPVLEAMEGTDTIGAVASDGKGGFAAANSTGGSSLMLLGRVGDSAHFGAGLWAGPAGAVATTGVGEVIIRTLAAKQVYDRMEGGAGAQEAAAWGLTLVEDPVPLGIIVAGREGHGIAANRSMPSATRTL